VLIHCFAGCPVHDVVAAIGMELSDLFPPRDDRAPTPVRDRWNPRAVFECVEREARIAMIAAHDAASGVALSDADANRVATAAARIEDALTTAGLRRT